MKHIIQIGKYTFFPLIIAVIIFYLCCLIPANDIPDTDFDFFIPIDKVVHFLMFFGLSLTACIGYIYLNKGHIIILKMIVFAILLPILYGGAIELIQHYYFIGRTGDWFDFLADAIGSLTVLPIALLFRRKLLYKYEMKKFLLSAILTLLISQAYAQNSNNNQYIVKVGDNAPNFEMSLPSGEKVQLSDLKGKVVMLQFTASWCGVCRKEMPHIEEEIWQRHMNNPNFALYGVDREENIETVINFAKITGVTYPIGLDLDGSIFKLFAEENAGITRNIIIDKNGKIVMLTRLFKKEEFEKMVNLIDTLLNKE